MRRKSKQIILIFICQLSIYDAAAQVCSDPIFNVTSTACINESIYLNNSSIGQSYSWDFCLGDLEEAATAEDLGTSDNYKQSFVIETIKEGGVNYTFMINSQDDYMTRLQWSSLGGEIIAEDTFH
ncbi:MAG: hypothetical protein ACJAZV_001503, partial [Roseivirga sp.]